MESQRLYVILDQEGYVDSASSTPIVDNSCVEIDMPPEFTLENCRAYHTVNGTFTLDVNKLMELRNKEAASQRRALSLIRAERRLQERQVARLIEETTDPDSIIELAPLLSDWTPRAYNLNDVIQYEDAPYRCVQAHDSTGNLNWTPTEARSLWANYHATSRDFALPWLQPTDAHDMYKSGEWMIWTDGNVYKCAQSTVYAPNTLPGAWTVQRR